MFFSNLILLSFSNINTTLLFHGNKFTRFNKPSKVLLLTNHSSHYPSQFLLMKLLKLLSDILPQLNYFCLHYYLYHIITPVLTLGPPLCRGGGPIRERNNNPFNGELRNYVSELRRAVFLESGCYFLFIYFKPKKFKQGSI